MQKLYFPGTDWCGLALKAAQKNPVVPLFCTYFYLTKSSPFCLVSTIFLLLVDGS